MGIYLQVNYTSQLPATVGGIAAQDVTGCWLHSANMVRSYFGDGPAIMPELYTPGHGHVGTGSVGARRGMDAAMRQMLQVAIGPRNTFTGAIPPGLQLSEHDILASRAGLEPVPQCETGHNFTATELEHLLRNHGPIFFYWWKTVSANTYGHASVLIGVTDDNRRVWFHDPENSPNKQMTVQQFNSKIRQRFRYGMMRRWNVRPAMVHPVRQPNC
ncbi:MAG TPA: papain-like cysteine protease family protein [Pyrinomonadaceae bacterium]|nr:papain-like cysteine protease family protein [Pyrinomonadaceae bacterium]